MNNNRKLEDFLLNKNFEILYGKCYLTDVGYHNIDYLLYFYCDVCYHPKA